MALLSESWPKQLGIFDAGGGKESNLMQNIDIYTELDALRDFDVDPDDEEDLEPDIFFLPLSADSAEQQQALFEHDDSSDEGELEDSFCLEDNIIEVFRDVDLYKSEPSPTANKNGKEVASMKEDEYLYLGYKKISEYSSNRIETSYFRLLQIIHNELFDTLGYPTWREMLKDGLVMERPTGSGSGSDTETASEGEEDSEDSDLDWDEVLEIRRHEAVQELKEREDKRREQERRQREIEREKARVEKLKELEREAKEAAQNKEKDTFTPKMKILGSDKTASVQDLAKKPLFRKKRKCGRPLGSSNKAKYGDEDFVVYDIHDDKFLCDGDQSSTPRRKRLRQPRSWEEFDELFAQIGLMTDATAEENKEEVRIRKRRIVHTDNGIFGSRDERVKMKAKRQKLDLVKNKKLKALKRMGKLDITQKCKDRISSRIKKVGRPPKIKTNKGQKNYEISEQEVKPKRKKLSEIRDFKVSDARPDGMGLKESPCEAKGSNLARQPNGMNKEVLGIPNPTALPENKHDQKDLSIHHGVSPVQNYCDNLTNSENALERESSVKEVGSLAEDVSNSSMEISSRKSIGKGEKSNEFITLAVHQSEEMPRPEEENSDKENLPSVGTETKVKDSEAVISQKKNVNGLEEEGTSAHSKSAEDSEEEAKPERSEVKCLDLGGVNLPKLPEKRSRRSVGRASELASQRKAMMDF